MMKKTNLGAALMCIALLVSGCGSPSGPTDRPAAAAPAVQTESAPTQAAPDPASTENLVAALPEQVSSTATPVDAAPTQPDAMPPVEAVATPAPAAKLPAPSPAPAASPTPPPALVAKLPAPAPAATSSPAPVDASAPAPAAVPAPAAATTPTPAVVDKGGPIAVAATKPGLSRVGNDNCETCHDVQLASWSESGHATRKPPLDCESCHGLGSEYSKNAVMKDPAKARAAGLVIPDRAFCSNCHTRGVTDAFLKKAHAHEE
ncbi:MAG: hypothetical protein MUO39_02860 [Steroidobacteraceae bacterium]|nr:hypothetical protein [Steroidobacteraceae bacterium]